MYWFRKAGQRYLNETRYNTLPSIPENIPHSVHAIPGSPMKRVCLMNGATIHGHIKHAIPAKVMMMPNNPLILTLPFLLGPGMAATAPRSENETIWICRHRSCITRHLFPPNIEFSCPAERSHAASVVRTVSRSSTLHSRGQLQRLVRRLLISSNENYVAQFSTASPGIR